GRRAGGVSPRRGGEAGGGEEGREEGRRHDERPVRGGRANGYPVIVRAAGGGRQREKCPGPNAGESAGRWGRGNGGGVDGGGGGRAGAAQACAPPGWGVAPREPGPRARVTVPSGASPTRGGTRGGHPWCRGSSPRRTRPLPGASP